MMDQDLLDAIAMELANLPGITTVTQTASNLSALPGPVMLLRLDRAVPDENPGDGRLVLNLYINAHLLVDKTTTNADQTARRLSIDTLSIVNRAGNFGVAGAGQPRPLTAKRHLTDTIRPGHDVTWAATWTAHWTQKIVLGDALWQEDGVTPIELIINGHRCDD